MNIKQYLCIGKFEWRLLLTRASTTNKFFCRRVSRTRTHDFLRQATLRIEKVLIKQSHSQQKVHAFKQTLC